jgi:predicted Fe-S protein YdhL (DUF1289 family)
MAIASPCTNVCTIDRRSGWCAGCARTVDEITRWPIANDVERAAIIRQLAARKAKLAAPRRWWHRA